MKNVAPAGSARIAGILLVFLAFAAIADQTVQTARMIDPQNVSVITWAWVLGLSIGGWFASSAPNLANWVEGEGVELLRKRLEVVQGFVVAMIAGLVAYLLALVAGTPNLLAFVGVLIASYSGDKYMQRIAAKRLP